MATDNHRGHWPHLAELLAIGRILGGLPAERLAAINPLHFRDPTAAEYVTAMQAGREAEAKAALIRLLAQWGVKIGGAASYTEAILQAVERDGAKRLAEREAWERVRKLREE